MTTVPRAASRAGGSIATRKRSPSPNRICATEKPGRPASAAAIGCGRSTMLSRSVCRSPPRQGGRGRKAGGEKGGI